ncbi:hypothetical protein Tco_0896575 [Tanacetum coccineum]
MGIQRRLRLIILHPTPDQPQIRFPFGQTSDTHVSVGMEDYQQEPPMAARVLDESCSCITTSPLLPSTSHSTDVLEAEIRRFGRELVLTTPRSQMRDQGEFISCAQARQHKGLLQLLTLG